jgi:ATP:ADP antiporter, AAA family
VAAWLTRIVDVRAGEARPLALSFAMLLLIIMGHTALETARDAILLTRFPASEIGVVYIAVAACALPAAALTARATVRFGVRRALIGGLLVSAASLVALYGGHTERAWVLAVYVTSALVGAVLVPLFWSLMGSLFTVAEGRRLVGPIGSAGVLGGTLGALGAAGVLVLAPVRSLLLVSAAIFLVAALVLLATLRTRDVPGARPAAERSPPLSQSTRAIRTDPFLTRIALLVVVSTAAVVTLDYFFKWTVAQTVPHEQVPRLVARYYAVLNVLSLVVQLFVSSALVRRAGVANAMVLTPLLLLGGGIATLAASGVLVAVLLLRGLEGTLINSVHRVTTELVYLPVPAVDRARTKPFIDGPVARATQAAAGVLLLALGGMGYLSAWRLAALVLVFVAVWLVTAITAHGPYLGLLRRAITSDDVGGPPGPEVDDAETAESLVEYLADYDPLVALAALNALVRRGRQKLIPALILLHEDGAVVSRALTVFAATERQDWIARARHFLVDPREPVRMAAARALAVHNRLESGDLAQDESPRVRGYAAVSRLATDADGDGARDGAVQALLLSKDEAGEEGRLGMLAALGDVRPSPRLSALVEALAAVAGTSREWTERLARAVAAQGTSALVPALVSRLSLRDGREVVRDALVSFGRPAMDKVWEALRDRSATRSLRVHLPNTLARFGTKAAAELLLECIENETDGLVRYKAVRGLGRLVSEQGISLSATRVQRLSHRNMVEHFRLLALRAPFGGEADGSPRAGTLTERLLTGLLDDKVHQSLERAFRLLKIAHPREDIHRVQIAGLSEDPRVRANAGEFLDTLLHRRIDWPLRDLLRVVTDTLSTAERVKRASTLLGTSPPRTPHQALATLVHDSDASLRALATLHMASLDGTAVQVTLGAGQDRKRSIELSTRETGSLVTEASHA